MSTLYMYCGISGSGKTYKAYEMHGEDAVILDSDAIRARICPGGETDQTMNARVFEYMYKETCECLSKDVDVCYVATNISAKRRISLLKDLKRKFKYLKCVCYIINTPISTCYKRNASRDRHVPDYVIAKQARGFQCPCEAEGWDTIEVIDNYDEDYDYMNCLADIEQTVKIFGSQNNSHHLLTLEEHCLDCGDRAIYKRLNNAIIQAAYIHDYGKAYTATRWEKDDYKETHYPNHAEVGSYLTLNMGYSLYVAQLVGAHMVPYMDEKAQATWKIRFGEKLWNDVLLLHQCDEEAH